MKKILFLISIFCLTACSLSTPRNEIVFSAVTPDMELAQSNQGELVLTYKYPVCLVQSTTETKQIKVTAHSKPKSSLGSWIYGLIGAVIEAVFSILD